MELFGTVKKILETQTFSSGFQKRELILLTNETYPQTLCIEFLSEKIGLLDNFSEGDSVKIGINIKGREWVSPQGETKYFTSINGWRIEKSESLTSSEPIAAAPASPTKKETTAEQAQDNPFDEEEQDDLPF